MERPGPTALLIELHKKVNHVLSELGLLRMELASRGLASERARRRPLSAGLLSRRIKKNAPRNAANIARATKRVLAEDYSAVPQVMFSKLSPALKALVKRSRAVKRS